MSDNESMDLSSPESWIFREEGPVARFRKSLAALAAPYQSGSKWFLVREDGISFPPARSGKGSKGPRSLVAMCLRVLADNIAASSEGWTESLPKKLVWALWKELSPRTMALDAWNMLGHELLDDAYVNASKTDTEQKGNHGEVTVPMAMYRYCQEIVNPPCQLSIYIDPLKRLERCLVYLCIDNVAQFETHELIPLGNFFLRLTVLELIEREPTSNGITDRLITAWSRGYGLGSLRVLKIWSNSHAVSERSLHHVLESPKLEIFDITALPAQRWRKAEEIAEDFGWKVTEPKGSLFASYAEAYVDGLVDVNVRDAERLRSVFDNDRQLVVLVDDPRWPMYQQWAKDREMHSQASTGTAKKEGRNGPDLSRYLDDGWRALLQGSHPLSTTADTQGTIGNSSQQQQHLSDDEVFWFLALLDQQNAKRFYPNDFHIQAQAEGITLPRDRFVSLRLRNPPTTSGQHARPADSARLIFSRRRGVAKPILPNNQESQLHREPPPPSWAPRADDRKVTDFKSRKRQRTTADLLSSFGIPSGKKSK